MPTVWERTCFVITRPAVLAATDITSSNEEGPAEISRPGARCAETNPQPVRLDRGNSWRDIMSHQALRHCRLCQLLSYK